MRQDEKTAGPEATHENTAQIKNRASKLLRGLF
jgi:hypothetical protein